MSLKKKIDLINEFNIPADNDFDLKLQIAAEELEECVDAIWWLYDDHTDEDRIKEIMDVFYTLLPIVEELGVDPDAAFNRVHISNMSKLWDGPNGEKMMVRDKKGKVQKGPDYRPPHFGDLFDV